MTSEQVLLLHDLKDKQVFADDIEMQATDSAPQQDNPEWQTFLEGV